MHVLSYIHVASSLIKLHFTSCTIKFLSAMAIISCSCL